MLESAYQAQIRALNLVWMLQAEEADAGMVRIEEALLLPAAPAEPSPVPEPPPPPPSRPRHRLPGEVSEDVLTALPHLPELFTRRDVCKALGYEPDRAVLYRILQELRQGGILLQESAGEGRRATVYRRTGASDSPADV